MVCSRGESLTHHTNQMKFFNAIAAAAVIGTSFIAPNPAEARNGWVLIGESNRGRLMHEKLDSFAQGRYANVQVADIGGSYPKTIDCLKWSFTFRSDGTGWRPVLPGTMGEASAERWCR